MNKERKRVCCNCGNCIRYPTKDGIRCRCAINDHYIGYLQCFEHWCRRWKRERKWDGEENAESNNGRKAPPLLRNDRPAAELLSEKG